MSWIMTGNQIIKALECCSVYNNRIADCIRTNCPLFIKSGSDPGCKFKEEHNKRLFRLAINLINHQKAEIEKLQAQIAIIDEYMAEVEEALSNNSNERVTKAIDEYNETAYNLGIGDMI